jgi:hypothetical protein
MKSIIILTADWTDEHGGLHLKGDVLAVPGYVLARERHYGIRGKYRFPLGPENPKPGTNVLPAPVLPTPALPAAKPALKPKTTDQGEIDHA